MRKLPWKKKQKETKNKNTDTDVIPDREKITRRKICEITEQIIELEVIRDALCDSLMEQEKIKLSRLWWGVGKWKKKTKDI